jgi:hypothetical protein
MPSDPAVIPGKIRRPAKLIIAVTVFFVEDRLRYLRKIAEEFGRLADKVDVYIFTNVQEAKPQDRIRRSLDGLGFAYKIMVPTLLGHPYLLAWSHLAVFRERFAADPEITHFMYLEDDICVRPDNIAYWLKGREDLRKVRLIPSFLRVEYKDGSDLPYSTDVVQRVNPGKHARVILSKDYVYLNLPQPYQGMYLLDRELMGEHLAGKSSNPDHGIWNIRERAAQGLTFVKVPPKCASRNFVGYNVKEKRIDLRSLIHHLPNTYVNRPASPYGKILLKDLIMGFKVN